MIASMFNGIYWLSFIRWHINICLLLTLIDRISLPPSLLVFHLIKLTLYLVIGLLLCGIYTEWVLLDETLVKMAAKKFCLSMWAEDILMCHLIKLNQYMPLNIDAIIILTLYIFHTTVSLLLNTECLRNAFTLPLR